jgi:erythronate-4-phosphate dehydrogenase
MASVLATLALKHGFSLQGKKIGIIGVGHVGSKVVDLARTLGMVPLLNDPPRERIEKKGGFVSLDEIQETADIITFHVPLAYDGPYKTYHIADEPFFRKLRKKPLLINTSRGAIVDAISVKNALANNTISGFCADVWENEPDLDLELLKMADIGTPHIAGYSVEGKANGTTACVRAASRFFDLGIDDWYPPLLPLPANPLIEINARGKAHEQVLTEAILATYNVMTDDAAFRDEPARFEYLRNYYSVRREFGAFKIKISNSLAGLKPKLLSLGFKIK